MTRLPDLVRDSKLEAQFLPDFSVETVHTYHESKHRRRQLVSVSEHWKRKKKIGGGGYATVWLEICPTVSRHGVRTRAVKQIETSGRFARIDFTRELETIAKFSHPKYEQCFVKSYGWYDTPKNLFITMEYLEFGDLHDYLHDRSPLPEDQAHEISSQILEGLQMMHENEFAHRDLKPRNLLIKSHPPDEWWIKIADFGISKRMEEDVDPSTTLRGSHGFIAPELYGFIQQGSIYATDVWSLGEIIFQILTKQPTFHPIGQLSLYTRKPELFPRSVLEDAGVTKSGIDFIHSLMQAKPEKRLTAETAFSHPWLEKPPNSSSMPQVPPVPGLKGSGDWENDLSLASRAEANRDATKAGATRRRKALSATDTQYPPKSTVGSDKGKEKDIPSKPDIWEFNNRRRIALHKAIEQDREITRLSRNSRDKREPGPRDRNQKSKSLRPQDDRESRNDDSRETIKQSRLRGARPVHSGYYSDDDSESLTSGTASNSRVEEEPQKSKRVPLRTSSRSVESSKPERSSESFRSGPSNRNKIVQDVIAIISGKKKEPTPSSKDNTRRSKYTRAAPRGASRETRSSHRDPKSKDLSALPDDHNQRDRIVIETSSTDSSDGTLDSRSRAATRRPAPPRSESIRTH